MHRQLMLCPVIELGRFEHRFGGNTAGVQARAAQRAAAVTVLPRIDADGREAVLRRADRRLIPGRPAADNQYIVRLAHASHIPSSMRPGSSRHSLTVTRNCTASRPSMIR